MNKSCVVSLVYLFKCVSLVKSKSAFLIAFRYSNLKMDYEATESILQVDSGDHI